MKDSSQNIRFDLTDFLPFQMAVVSNRLFQRVIGRSGLQMPEWRILMALPTNQPCSSNDLCLLTAMDAARVSRAQRRLEELELIDVTQDGTDRRRLVVRLSDRGTQEVERLQDVARKAESELLDTLDPERRAALKTALASLFERV